MKPVKKDYIRPLDLRRGRGGWAAAQLIEERFLAAFDNGFMRQINDGAVFTLYVRPKGNSSLR